MQHLSWLTHKYNLLCVYFNTQNVFSIFDKQIKSPVYQERLHILGINIVQ